MHDDIFALNLADKVCVVRARFNEPLLSVRNQVVGTDNAVGKFTQIMERSSEPTKISSHQLAASLRR